MHCLMSVTDTQLCYSRISRNYQQLPTQLERNRSYMAVIEMFELVQKMHAQLMEEETNVSTGEMHGQQLTTERIRFTSPSSNQLPAELNVPAGKLLSLRCHTRASDAGVQDVNLL